MEKAIFIKGHLKVASPPFNPDIDSMLLLTSSRNVGVARLTWLLCSAIISNVPDMASILPSADVLSAW